MRTNGYPLRTFAAALMAAWLLTSPAEAEPEKKPLEGVDFKDQLPRIKPVEPEKVLETFKVHPEFRVELAASEPVVADPVALDFDEDGRLFVVEMRGYSEDPDDLLGQVRRLEDTDGDGVFDKSTVYVDGLSWPTALICYGGGVFIGEAPHIHYAKDTDGDGVADEKRTVFTGFGRGNVQGLVNSFRWGLDNRIHGATSSSGASLRRADDKDAPVVSLRGRDFAFDPRTLEYDATSGGGQHGMSFDDWGRKFVSQNSNHIQQVMFEDRYIARNKYLAAPGPRLMMAADGPQAEVYRISPVEPWRIIRTKLRVAGIVPGPVEGGGRAAGYFTGATGVTIYRGDAWPEKYHGNALIGDVGSNIVHRKVLENKGMHFMADRAREKVEFVASKDIWFRPCQFANGPDGGLFVADVYREVIEHPKSLPPVIKKHLDLTAGRERGRIYRIVPKDFKRRKTTRLSKATTAELVATLGHPNGWHRDTAQRLLYERQDLSAAALLEKLAESCELPQGRMHALYALDGLGALRAEAVLTGLEDEHPRVREHAVKLAEGVAAGAAEVREKLYGMVGDVDIRVRYQLAFSLGELRGPRRNAALVELARRDAGDRWIRLAILSSLFRGSGEVFAELAADKDFRSEGAGRGFLSDLAEMIGAQNRSDAVATVLQAIGGFASDEQPLREAVLKSLTAGMAKSGGELRERVAEVCGSGAGELLDDLVTEARRTAADAKKPAAERVEAVGLLALGPFEPARPLLEKLLDPAQPLEVQAAALSTLSRFDEPDVAEIVIRHWPGLSPSVRTQAGEVLFARPERIEVLLDAIDEKRLRVTDLDPARLRLLLKHDDPSLRQRAEEVLGSIRFARRQEVVEAYQDALTLDGDPERGRGVFKKVCAACHKVEGVGHEIGPNLVTLQNRGPETILLNVLDPNREANPQYVNYVAVTLDGRSVTGMISAETATSVTLTRAEKKSDTLLRVNIDELKSTGLSIMPEGLEKEIDQQAMADLIAYLLSIK